MTTWTLTIVTLSLAVLIPGAECKAHAHEIETHISRDGLDSLGPAIAAQVPDEISLPEIEIPLFECSGEDASILVKSSEVSLTIHELALSQPLAGQLQLDLRFSATTAGEVDFNRVIFCGSKFTCQDSLSLQDVGARVLLESREGEGGTWGLEVVDVDLDIDSDRFDLSLSGCEYADMVNSLVDITETLGVSVLANLVESIVAESLAPAIEDAASGLSGQSVGLLRWQITTALQALDLSDGLRVIMDADIRSENGPASCLQDPGEPRAHPGAPPALSGASDLSMSLNLGIFDDLLYHVWASTAQCPSLVTDAGFIGDYLARFPADTDWELEATVTTPPYVEGVEGDALALQMVFNDIELELIAHLGDGSSLRARVVVDARTGVTLGIDASASALALKVHDAQVTRLVIDDELNLADQGLDAAHLSQFLNDVFLPAQLASYLDSDVSLPLGFGAGRTHLILREVRTNSAYARVGLDLFLAPDNDSSAPNTDIVSAPQVVVRHDQALVYVSGKDSQVPSELLRYQVLVNGVEMPTSNTSRLQIGLANHSATYSVAVAAMDLAGNVDPTPERVELVVDGIRPTVAVDYDLRGNSLAIDFQALDDRSDPSTLRARVFVTDTASGIEVRSRQLASGVGAVELSDLAGGQSYRVTVVVIDEVGNEGATSFVVTTASVGGCSTVGATSTMGAILLLLAILLLGTKRGSLIRITLSLVMLSGVACAEDEPNIAEGEESLALPACASELARSMWQALQPVAERSTISMQSALGKTSRVDPQLYIDGPAIFSKWASLVEGAEMEVDMQFYKWEPETDATETILAGIKALEERRKREQAKTAIPVRIVIDTSALGVAAPATEEHMPWVMARVEAYDIDPAYVDLRFAVVERGFLNQFGNLHVKTMVVDGKVAIITGANPEHQHNFDKPWHDLATVFYGDIVTGVLDDIVFTRLGAQDWVCSSHSDDRATCLVPTEAVARQSPSAIETPVGNACVVLALTRTPSLTANNRIDNPQDQAFLAAFRGAQRVIKIETPNINDDAVKAAIIDAVQRGVEVRLITSKGFNEASEGFVGGPNGQNVAELYRDLALLGLEDPCATLQVRWYSRDGMEPILGNGAYASHTKYTSVDDQIVIVGTTNMDTASWNFSHELNLAIDDATLAKELNRQLFDADWQRALPVDECAGH